MRRAVERHMEDPLAEEIIHALPGDDFGQGGNDTLTGGPGADTDSGRS